MCVCVSVCVCVCVCVGGGGGGYERIFGFQDFSNHFSIHGFSCLLFGSVLSSFSDQ